MKKALCFLTGFFYASLAFAYPTGSGSGYKSKADAKDITVKTTNFSRNLSSTDSDVQHALETLDQLVASGGGTWGSITGTLSSQTDLQTALNAKQNLLVNSAGLAAALSDETGSGLAVFGTTPTFTTSIVCPLIKPPSDATTAFQITKADGSTNVVNIDTTNIGMGVGTTSPSVGDFGSTFTAYGGTGLGIITAQRNDSTATHGTGFQCVLNDASNNPITYSYFNGVIIANTAGAASGALAFYTRNAGTLAERMRLDNAGKLGINTSTFGTQAKLTVNPNTTTNNNAIAQINTVNIADDALVLNMVASPTGNAVNVTNNSGTTVARLTSLGKMALGSSVAPVSQLYIQATSAAQGFIVGNVDSLGQQSHFGICTGNTGNISGEYWNTYKDANGWIFNSAKTNGTTRRVRWLFDDTTLSLSLNTDGTAAIGVLNPSAQFEVDNGANARSIFVAKDNTSAVFTIADGGPVTSTSTISSTGFQISGAAASGIFLVGNGTSFVASTSTIPTSAGATANKVLLSDGTNYVLSTPTFPNASATSLKHIRSDGTNWIASTVTYPDASVTAGKVIVSDGTNYIASTPTFPNASATSGKIIKSDGTNWTASTETYAAPSTSGNVLTSDGTNWTSAVPVVTASNTVTLTNKRITKRDVTTTQSATPTINTDNTDVAHITGLAQAITSMTTNLSGTPVAGDTLRIDITDDGTARAITWGASFEASGTVALPTTTVISTRLDVGFVWNEATTKWRCVASA